MGPIIFATGHRPQNLDGDFTYKSPLCMRIKEEMREFINIKSPSMGVAGGALGVDTMWALAILDAGVPLYLALPSKTQSDIWRPEAKELYKFILSRAHIVKYISDAYTFTCMEERNHHMVDISTEGLSVYRQGSSGGTANCLKYAKIKNVPVYNIDPDSLIKQL